MNLHDLDHSKYTRARSESCFGLIAWREYSRAAFEAAAQEKKPIFLLISAPAWCHWCHVYESEDFLFAPEVYSYINENYIPIFVDADKRPDVTRERLEGGWPTTVLLSPTGIRAIGFSGPQTPSVLRHLLEQVVEACNNNELMNSAKNDTGGSLDIKTICTAHVPSRHALENIVTGYVDLCRLHADSVYGGFGSESKFPQGYTLSFLLEYSAKTHDEKLKKMIELETDHHYTNPLLEPYHLFDPVEGGFHRYSVHGDWTNPHYEKMLSDNARLLKFYATYARHTQDPRHTEMANKTFSYVLENLTDTDGGFFSSQDADGEKHYYGVSKKERAKREKPAIDKTKYTPSNAEMSITFLELAQHDWRGAKKAALAALTMLAKRVDRHKGVAHYDNVFLGELADAAFAGLALLNGHLFINKTQEPHPKKYVAELVSICDFLVERLYDKCDGGFFARFVEANSTTDENIAYDEDRVSRVKPLLENGVAAYLLLSVAELFNDESYRRASLTTLNYFSGILQGFDEQYYFAKAAQMALQTKSLGNG